MNTPEIPKSNELVKKSHPEANSWDSALTEALVEEVCQRRAAELERLRPAISLAFYNRLNEKLEREKRKFRSLLSSDNVRKQFLSRYSLILNPSYFEQKLWKP